MAVVAVLTSINLRGVRESGTAFAVPTYAFMVAIIGMGLYGFYRIARGTLPLVESSGLTSLQQPQFEQGLIGLGWGFLLLRAFSSGCAALTGVEAISNGVPAFQKPKSKNAATTLALLGAIAVTMLMSVIVLAQQMQIRYSDEPATHLLRDGIPVGEDYVQHPVIGQIATALFEHAPVMFYLVTATTGLILVLAANTAFNGFPVLGSILARDDLMPRQLHTRGDRLAFSNGIVMLAAAAAALILVFDAEVTQLIQLYIVGVFVSFTVSQTGMVRHWTRLLRTETHKSARRRMARSRIVNSIGLTITGGVLVIVLVTKFLHGAYLALIAMSLLYLLMLGIRRHYAVGAQGTGDRRQRRGACSCPPGCTPSCWSPRSTSRRCGRWPTPGPRVPRCWRRSPWWSTRRTPRGCSGTGTPGTSRCPCARSTRRTGRSPGRSSTTSRASARTAPGTWSWSTCPSTSSGTGGSRCCTTRARCG